METYRPETIFEMDGGLVSLDNEGLRLLVADTFCLLPCEMVDDIMTNCLFLMPQSAGGYITKRIIAGRNVIFLHPSLVVEPEHEKMYALLHEVAHYVLGHESPLEWGDEVDAGARIDQQEKEADEFVRKYLKTHKR